MAATGGGKKGKKKKGKTLNLNEFLVSGDPVQTFVPLKPRKTDWADDDAFTGNIELAEEYGGKPKVDLTKLPSAPRSSRGVDIDLSRLPSKPPYTAFLGNLPFDVQESDVKELFRGLKVENIRFPQDVNRRNKGFGYAEFFDVEQLKLAIALNGDRIRSRQVRIDIADTAGKDGKGDDDRMGEWRRDYTSTDGQNGFWGGGDVRGNDFARRDGGFRQSSSGGEGGDRVWRREEPSPPRASSNAWGGRSGFREGSSRGGFRDDRGGGGFKEDRGGGGFRDDRGGGGFRDDRGGGGFRDDRGGGGFRDDRGGGGFRDDRGGGGFRDDRGGGGFRDDRGGGGFREDRGSGSGFRDDRGGGGGFRDDRGGGGGFREDRGRSNFRNDRGFRDDKGGDGDGRNGYERSDRGFVRRDEQKEPESAEVKERKKLNLKPRTAPDGESVETKASSIFGNARPVDTAAKERQIEEKLSQMNEEGRAKLPEKEFRGRYSKSRSPDSRKVSEDHNEDWRDDGQRRARVMKPVSESKKVGVKGAGEKKRRSDGPVNPPKYEEPAKPVFSTSSKFAALGIEDDDENSSAEGSS